MTSAPEIILLPGLDGDGFYFGPLVSKLQKHCSCRIISYPPHLLTYDELCLYIASKLENVPNCIIVAESFGGPLGVKLAHALKERAKALILCATYCRSPFPAFVLKRLAQIYPYLIHSKIAEPALNFFLFNGEAPEKTRQVLAILRSQPDNIITQRMREIAPFDMRSDVKALTIPCMIIHAKEDRLVWKSGFESTHTTTCINGPHELGGSRADEVAKAITDFIESL